EEVLLAQEFEPDLPLSEAPHGKQTWYSSTSGIWQSVTLERRPPVALGALRVRPDLESDQAVVRWSLDAGSDAGATPGLSVELLVRDPEGSDVGAETIEVAGERDGVARIPIPSP